MRTAVSLRRKERDVPLEDRALAALQGGADPMLARLKETYLAGLTTAWRTTLRELDARDRTLLKLHLVDRLSVDKLGLLYGVHATTTARWLRQLRQRLSDRVCTHLQAVLAVDATDIASIVALIDSQLDVTLGALLSDAAEIRTTQR